MVSSSIACKCAGNLSYHCICSHPGDACADTNSGLAPELFTSNFDSTCGLTRAVKSTQPGGWRCLNTNACQLKFMMPVSAPYTAPFFPACDWGAVRCVRPIKSRSVLSSRAQGFRNCFAGRLCWYPMSQNMRISNMHASIIRGGCCASQKPSSQGFRVPLFPTPVVCLLFTDRTLRLVLQVLHVFKAKSADFCQQAAPVVVLRNSWQQLRAAVSQSSSLPVSLSSTMR